jgi:hypothetical protein
MAGRLQSAWRRLGTWFGLGAGPGGTFGRRLTAEERAAEERAEGLLGATVGAESLEAYRALGFLHLEGKGAEDGLPAYAYLIYPQRPIVSYEARTGRLLNELCVRFPDRDERGDEARLPDADDVLAKWLALRGDELTLLAEANVDRPGTQIDPDQVRRDLLRLEEWTGSFGATDAGDSGGMAATQ